MGENDGALFLARKAAGFAWSDVGTDLAKLQEIARSLNLDGSFSLLDDFRKEAEGEVSMQLSPALFAWQRWLSEKYDRDTSFIILAKFGQLLCNGGLEQENSPNLN